MRVFPCIRLQAQNHPACGRSASAARRKGQHDSALDTILFGVLASPS